MISSFTHGGDNDFGASMPFAISGICRYKRGTCTILIGHSACAIFCGGNFSNYRTTLSASLI